MYSVVAMAAVCVKDLEVQTVLIFSKNALRNTYEQNNQLTNSLALQQSRCVRRMQEA
jgi:hypothetical protein